MLDKYNCIVFRYWPSHTGGYSSESYARDLMIKCSSMLKDKGIPNGRVSHNRRMTHPIGSGSGGRVRWGDDWIPTEYFIYVAIKDREKAIHYLYEYDRNLVGSLIVTDMIETIHMTEA